mmetsp:Transcript_65959/g.159106  ORF Transcript_65959/g.159106 Transcript_65959/m.159106 type:complete len:311 (+) Transcript_65959:709-1641(+)
MLDGVCADAWPRGLPCPSDGQRRHRGAARARRGATRAGALPGLGRLCARRARAGWLAPGGGEHRHVYRAGDPRWLPLGRRHCGAVVRAAAAADAGGRHPTGGGGGRQVPARPRAAAAAAAHAGARAALRLLHLHRAPPRLSRPHHARPHALRTPPAAILRVPHAGPAMDGRGAAAPQLLHHLRDRRALVLRVGRALSPQRWRERLTHGPRWRERGGHGVAAHAALLLRLARAWRAAGDPGTHVPLLPRALPAPSADRRRGQARASTLPDALLPALLPRWRGSAAPVPLTQRIHPRSGARPFLLPGRQDGL